MFDMLRDGLSLNRPALGIDLGTQNTVICDPKGKVIANEPTLVAKNKKTGELHYGRDAQKKFGYTSRFEFIRLLSDGTIETNKDEMVQGFLKHVMQKSPWNRPDVVIAISCRLEERDLKSVDLAAKPLVNEVGYIYQPFGAAIGHGIDPLKTQSTIVWDIGHGTTDGLAISDEDNVFSHAISVAGSEMDQAIIAYMLKKHNAPIDELLARRIKHGVGCAMLDGESLCLPLRSIITNETDVKFSDIVVLDSEVCEALDEVITEIEAGLGYFLSELGRRNPAITTTMGGIKRLDESDPGPDKLRILLGGGCSQLRRLAERFAKNLDINVERITDPLKAAAIGAAKCVREPELLRRYAVNFADLTPRETPISSNNHMDGSERKETLRQIERAGHVVLHMPNKDLKTA